MVRAARVVYKGEHIPESQATSLVLCSDPAIRTLNARFRNVDRATDVLSFEFGEPDLLGEIYISLQRAKAQAGRFKVSYREEMLRLLVHGLLHLAGYDHARADERALMRKREERYLQKIL